MYEALSCNRTKIQSPRKHSVGQTTELFLFKNLLLLGIDPISSPNLLLLPLLLEPLILSTLLTLP